VFATAHRHRLAFLPLLLILVTLIAAACSDNDFDDAPDDRGALAGDRVGAVAAESEADQAAPAAESEATASEATDAEPTASETDQATAADTGNIEDGSDSIAFGNELFFENGCNICHGDTGQGGIGPAIAQTTLTLDQVISQYRNPRAVMPAFQANRISDDQVANIYAFLQSLE
jgi:mono/diheme cytochrome c family protein